VPGAAAARSAARRSAAVHPYAANGNMDYNGGPVVHSMAPYLIYWVPSGETFSSTTQNLITRYFTDVAHDSGLATNVYGALRQYTDSTGFADYNQTFSSGSQAIVDTQAYPTTGQCTTKPAGVNNCLTDTQLHNEINRLITADGLPTDGTNSSQLANNAPQYYVVLPTDVNECQSGTTCGSNVFCAYHGAYNDGSNIVLYAAMPTYLDSTNPKGCQFDGNAQVQKPNGDQVGDVFLKALSHEQAETISDPLLNAWWNSTTSGNEVGDNCNFAGAFNPNGSSNPNAFTPTLGGSAALGTLFNQSDNGNPYYIQSEWSNGDINCVMQPTSSSLASAFSVAATGGTAVNLDPSASTSASGFSSVSWNFGDGQSSFSTSAPAVISHTFGGAGTFTVKLTEVDALGNLSRTTQQVTVGASPSGSFSLGPNNAVQGTTVSFSGSASDPNTGVATAVGWNFGDGSTGTGASTTHAYSTPGTYTVTMGIVDTAGNAGTVTHTVTVTKATITSVSVKNKTKKGATIVVGVNAAGKVSGGGKSKTAGGAGNVSLKIKLSKSQRNKLASQGKLTVKIKVTFQPNVGSAVTKTVKIKFKA
jgi:PKD repeat protein